MANFIITSDGYQLDTDSLPHRYTYINGVMVTDTIVSNGNYYTQTYTYTSGVLTSVSSFIKQ
jgi:hypothetical protein